MITILAAAVVLAATSQLPQPPRPAEPPAVWMAVALHQGGNSTRLEVGEGKELSWVTFAALDGKESCRQVITPRRCDIFDRRGNALFSWTLQAGRLHLTLHGTGPVRVEQGGE